jgi:hypothetical protein
MSASSNDSPNPDPDALREPSAAYPFDLPVEPGHREKSPSGTWEDGYRLSLQALELVKDRPEIFQQRNQQMCSVEFVL